jgi:hypothetical protein
MNEDNDVYYWLSGKAWHGGAAYVLDRNYVIPADNRSHDRGFASEFVRPSWIGISQENLVHGTLTPAGNDAALG